MIIKYHEQSEEVTLHSHAHKVCTPEHVAELEPGWECTCSECQCATVVNIKAAYAYGEVPGHGVMVTVNPGQYRGRADFALTPDKARELASYLMFAAIDAETLNREYSDDWVAKLEIR